MTPDTRLRIVRTLLFTALSPVTLTILLPWWILGRSHPRWDAPGCLGAIAIFGGACICIRCAADFIRKGLGTPAPYAPPQKLVDQGLYALTRNPMYVGVVTVILGEAMLFDSWRVVVYGVVVATGFHLRVKVYEEPLLRKTFGDEYVRYCGRAPRWLW